MRIASAYESNWRVLRAQELAVHWYRKWRMKYFASPVFATFCELKHGIVGEVLGSLQAGEISRGRAAELLAEIAHGATKVNLPVYEGEIFAEDETPIETVHRLKLRIAELEAAAR